MVGLQAFVNRRAPKRLIPSRQPGFEFVENESGGFEHHDSEQTALKSLPLAFFAKDGEARSPIEKTITERHLAEPWLPLHDTMAHRAGASGHRHPFAGGGACGQEQEHDPAKCGCREDFRHGRGASLHTITVGSIQWETSLAFNQQWWALTGTEFAANSMPCGCH
jgi:hypothetical protein